MTNVTPAMLKALADGDMENAITAATPGGIEAQEAAGQQGLVRTFSQFPKEYLGRGDAATAQKYLLSLGFQFGDDIDDLFVSVTPPPGWSIKATGHSMHNDVVDDKGRVRLGIFYKAAFYDRRADYRVNRRYEVQTDYDGEYENGTVTCNVVDRATGSIIFHGDTAPQKWGDEREQVDKSCNEFLSANFPKHSDPFAYSWDVAE
ncbi:MAG: hypothetical protein GDA50_04310 [Alphaproteobacteria bacterium GM202ARS2]|nr:hypothetical protein [Alphaproteobacteria bacterium GM202ARS2]